MRNYLDSEANKENKNEYGVSPIKKRLNNNHNNKKKYFDLQNDYLNKEQCTTFYFGTEQILQMCYVCPCCNPTRDKKLCKFCYDKCHQSCRDHEHENSEKVKETWNHLKDESFSCYCGLKSKHRPDVPEVKELVPCNMLQLDQVLNVNSIWCATHSIQVCCICSVTCHKSCKIVKEKNSASGKCSCRTDFHTGFNELALTFPLNEYREKAEISVWSIQILNILFSTKNIFQKMSELFQETLTSKSQAIDDSFFPLLELFSNTWNRKFKTFYYNEELLNMFQYENLTNFLFGLPMDNSKVLLVKFRLIFILLFMHLKVDYQKIKTLTSIDFMTSPIWERFKYQMMITSPSWITEEIIQKYSSKKGNVLMRLALDEACNLMETGINHLSIEENQDEFEIGLKFICFLLKRKAFENSQLNRLIVSLSSFYEKFFEYLNNKKSNIYGLLSIFNTFSEIFFMIGVSYNDNILFKYIENKGGDIGEFIHTKSEYGAMLFKMVIKSCEIWKRHYAWIEKSELSDKTKAQIKWEEAQRQHLLKIQNKIDLKTTGVKLKLPSNGGLLMEKVIKMLNDTLKLFCLADNEYYNQIDQIDSESLKEYYEFRKKIQNKEFGSFYTNVKNKKDKLNAIFKLKQRIEKFLYNLFNGSYTDVNLRINTNIYIELNEFIKYTTEKFEYEIKPQYEMLKAKNKLPVINEPDEIPEKEDRVNYFSFSILKKLKDVFPFVSTEMFPYYKESFIDTWILFSWDETIAKLLVFFSTRNYPHLLSLELFDLIIAFLKMYMLTKAGMNYLWLGKNLSRLCKVFKRYQCMSEGKNKNYSERYHRTWESNLLYSEKTLNMLCTIAKGTSVYRCSLKNHKVLLRFKDNILEHIESMLFMKAPGADLIQTIKRHLSLSIKIFNYFSDNFEYEDFEYIKKKIMWLFINSPLGLTEKNIFIQLYDWTNIAKYDKQERNNYYIGANTKHRLSTSKLVVNKTVISERERLWNKSNKTRVAASSEQVLINNNEDGEEIIAEGDDDYNKAKNNLKQNFVNHFEATFAEKEEIERSINIKMYFALFTLVTKNTYYVYKQSMEEELYDKILHFNSISHFKTLFKIDRKYISLNNKQTLLRFLRSWWFIEHWDKITLFSKDKALTNAEYKTMIYSHLVHVDGWNEISNQEAELDQDDINALRKKHEHIIFIESIIDIYLSELTEFPSQCEDESVGSIEDFVKELIFGVKFIADYFYWAKDLINKLWIKFYLLTKEFLVKSDLLTNIMNDIKNNGKINDDYEKKVHPKLEEIKYSSFNIYDKNWLYTILVEEIDALFVKTNWNENCSLPKYLDIFDNMAEANFTPFSLIEAYDYEYFYQEASDENEEELWKDKLKALLHNANESYLAQFIDITNTNFYIVISSISNESIRIDYRKKIVDYFHAFFNSKDGYLTYKLESILCIIDKMWFYDSNEMQGKFKKLRNDKFFFPNFNSFLHQFLILTIVSTKNLDLFDRSMRMISLTKLTVQFIQLLGEGFNLDYHDNIFKLQKEVVNSGKYNDSHYNSRTYSGSYDSDGSYSGSYSGSDNGSSYSDSGTISSPQQTGKTSSKRSIQSGIKSKRSQKGIATSSIAPGTEENKIIFIDETIYHTLLINLKRCYSIINMEQTINAELPYDKLIVLTTNIIDFWIEYIDTSDDKAHWITEGIDLVFFGKRIIKTDNYFEKIDKKGLIQSVLFTKIYDNNIGNFTLRKKLICYVKIKYLQWLMCYLQTGKHEETVNALIANHCGPIELFSEILFNFYYIIVQIQGKNEGIYKKWIAKQSDDSFIQELLNVYIYEEIFRDIIEFSLCMKIFILIRTFEEIYNQNMLKNHFNKILANDEMKQTETLGQESQTDINSWFSKRIYLFLQKLVLRVEVKTLVNEEGEDDIKEANKNNKIKELSLKLVKGIKNDSENEDAEEKEKEGKQANDQTPTEEPETRLTFFIRPFLTFRLSTQAMISFEETVDRTNATNKFMELVHFSDYALWEMIINEHLIGKSWLKNYFSNLMYIYFEAFNYLLISVHNVFVIMHFYKSPDSDVRFYDVVDENWIYHLFDDNYYLSLAQAGFLVLTLWIWFYFKFPWKYQHCIMKRYNKNFVFRKKGDGKCSSSLSSTIVKYFQDMSMSTYSVIFDKNKDLSYWSVLYVAIFDALWFNREICILLYNLIFLIWYWQFKSSMFLVIPMIFIANIATTLFDIFKAITMKFGNMISVLWFTCWIVYLYMWITYFYMSFWFDFDDIVEPISGEKIREVFCNSSVQCLLFMIQQGLTAGGGIGEVLPMMSFQTDPLFFFWRFFYDMIFFIFVILILFNVFMGIIVDTFAELRDWNWGRENDIKNICFICQLSRDDCLTKNIDFNDHVKNDHYLWNYVYFLAALHTNNPNDFNSIENFVWEKLENQDYGWIPIMKNAD